MTFAIFLLLVILIVALVLFSFEWVPADVTALGVLLVLILSGLLPVEKAFAGFGSETVLLLLGLLIMTAALMRTGVVEMAGRVFLRVTHERPERLLVLTMLATSALSAFISNTAAAAFFLPVVLGLSRRTNFNVSRLLMPLAFAAILSSSITLISTSTNIVVSGLMRQGGLAPIGMFELTMVGLPIWLAGLLYMWTIGQRLIPDRTPPSDTDDFGLRPYLAELRIPDESPLAGVTLAKSGLGRDLDLTVLSVIRGNDRYLVPPAETQLASGDVLLVEGSHDAILRVKDVGGIDIQADAKFADPDIQAEALGLAEVVILPRSMFIGRTLSGLRARERYQIQVLAISRHTGTVYTRIAHTRLRMGDVLLVQGTREKIAALKAENAFDVLGVVDIRPFNRRRAWTSIGIFGLVLGLAAFNVIALPVAVLLGALLVFLARCITPEEAYRQVEWKVLILIGCMLALGAAMEHTGAAVFFSEQIIRVVGNWHPVWLLTAFFFLTVLLTQPMSNQAAAAVVVPVALQLAVQLGLNPRTFAIMIAVAASTSYLTPLEPACLMVYGPGRYRFVDFLKVGAPLTVLIYLLAVSLVPLIWPLSIVAP
ncbi:MAG: SLC13 family permease [Chloroflexota bacterium]